MSERFPGAIQLRIAAAALAAVVIVGGVIGLIGGVIRNTGLTATQTLAGYCLFLVVVSCSIALFATFRGFTAVQVCTVLELIPLGLLIAIWRFDDFYGLTWFAVFPLGFFIALSIGINKMHRKSERNKVAKPPRSEPLVGASTGH